MSKKNKKYNSYKKDKKPFSYLEKIKLFFDFTRFIDFINNYKSYFFEYIDWQKKI